MDPYRVRELMRAGTPVQQIPLRVTYYARVSTEKEEQASSLENQIAHYTAFIGGNPVWTMVEGYIDEGVSGAGTKKRDQFNRMIRDGERGLFDLIVTKEISRFSRSTVDSIQYTQRLLRWGVGVLFENDGINTLDPDAELRLAIMSSLAQDELRRLSERVKFGHRQSIQKGKVLGNDRLYGYHKKNCVLTVNEEQAAVVRQIFDLYANHGLGLRKISALLYSQGVTSSRGNPFNTRTIANMLGNPKYKGYYCGGKTTCTDYRTRETLFLPESEWVVYKDKNIPAIVPEELWDRAHQILRQRGEQLRQRGAVFHNRYAYSGKLVCGEHGTSYQRQLRESGREVWQCRVYRERGAKACTAPILTTDELDRVMAELLQTRLGNRNRIIDKLLALLARAEGAADSRLQKDGMLSAIQALEAKKEKLLELAVEGAVSNGEFARRNELLNEEIHRHRQRLSALEEREVDSGPDLFARVCRELEQALSFEDGVDSWLAASILEKAVVVNTGDKKHISLEARLVTGEVVAVSRRRGGTALWCNNS